MTPEVEEKILKTVRLGLHPERAAIAHGISPGTMRAHRKRNEEFATRLKEAEAVAEASYLAKIIKHTDKQWTAAAWMLERRWGERWARKDNLEVDAKVDAKVATKGPPEPSDAKTLTDYATMFAAAAASLQALQDEQQDPSASTDPGRSTPGGA